MAVATGQGAKADRVPAGNWGYFKVPGSWPGVTDYMQKDCQTVYAHPELEGPKNSAASPRPGISGRSPFPANGPAAALPCSAEYLNSYAAVYVDGKKAGEIAFPAGEVDLTAALPAGRQARAQPAGRGHAARGVMLSFSDTAAAREVRGTVMRRGLCGDVYLVSTPAGPRIADVKVDTSVRKGRDHVRCGAARASPPTPGTPFAPRSATTAGSVGEFTSKPFSSRRPEGRPHRLHREMEAREALGPPHAAEHV